MVKVFYNLIKLSRWVLERVSIDWYEDVKALLDADAQAEAERLARIEADRLEAERLEAERLAEEERIRLEQEQQEQEQNPPVEPIEGE